MRPLRPTKREQSKPFTGMIGAWPRRPPNSTDSPTPLPTTGMMRTAVVFWLTMPIAASSAMMPAMVAADVSPGIAIMSRPTEQTHVMASSFSMVSAPAVGDSVADILKEIGLEHPGAPGTTAALALLNDQVKKGGVMASSYVGGLSGAFIPVSEDQGMIDAVNAGALTIEKLEAMTCVCSVGLDMIAVPGDTSAATIAGIIADEAAIGMVNQKTTAVRIIPVVGKGVGDTVEFGGLLGHAPIMPVNGFDCSRFVGRKGRIPAPIHSFKN